MGHFIKRPLIYPGRAETHKIHLFITYVVVKGENIVFLGTKLYLEK